MSHLGYLLHSAPAPSVVRHVLDFSFTLLTVLLVALPYMPLLLPQLFSTLFAMLFVALPHVPFSLPLFSSFLLSKESILYTCTLSLHT